MINIVSFRIFNKLDVSYSIQHRFSKVILSAVKENEETIVKF